MNTRNCDSLIPRLLRHQLSSLATLQVRGVELENKVTSHSRLTYH